MSATLRTPRRLVRAPAHADDPCGLAAVARAPVWISSGRVEFSSMKAFLRGLFGLIAALALGGAAMAADLENTLYLDVPAGRVVIEMRPDLAPATVAQIKTLARQGFYDGIVFHRVIDGFMAQTGDPKGDGTGGSGHPLKAEFSNEKHVRGTVSMARASDPNSADSQFFIMFGPSPSLDGKYTIWGMVTSGMDNVDKIKKGDSARNGTVANPDKIIKMQVAAHAEKKS